MESLTLNEKHPTHRYAGHYRSKDRRQRSPRLPTPEDSRSSNENFDDHSPRQTSSSVRSLLHPTIGDNNSSHHSNGHSRRDSGNAIGPHSAYRIPDQQKPSLPPLKTVLGDNMVTSPPRTPSPHDTAMEPAYTASIYRPLALYPHKKQRVEPALHSAPLRVGISHPSATLEPTPYTSSLRPNVQFPPLTAPVDRLSARRPSHTATSPSWGAQYPSQKPSSSHDAAASHYQTPEQTPTSSMAEPSFPRMNHFAGSVQDPFAREMRESLAHSGDRLASRRGSLSNYGPYPSRPYDREAPRTIPYQQGAHHAIPLRGAYNDARESMRYGGRPDEMVRPYGQPPYHHQANMFFMPGPYEYQHGKARKRSNLPKQSTEIMKTWFDQNITNPYPSEEQKAIFSNATGISMTQVSNWFINHRRRCPELRDKRDKGRVRDCD